MKRFLKFTLFLGLLFAAVISYAGESNGNPEAAGVLPRCHSDSDCRQGGLRGRCNNPGGKNASCSFPAPHKIDLLVIDTKDGVARNTDYFIGVLKKRIPGISVRVIDYPGREAQKMIRKLSLEVLPAYILPRAVEKEADFDSFKKGLRPAGNFYLVKPQTSGFSYFLNRKEKKGRFDIFLSFFDKNAALLLERLREFKPFPHFLVTENKGGGFSASGGAAETEESLRAVCVQKYYPDKFWDYLTCRAKNVRSSYWEDCLGDAGLCEKIKICARGKEGESLLKDNISLNRNLRIASGPTYLLDNRRIFSSREAPSREEFKKILGK